MTLWARYKADLQTGEVLPDPLQEYALQHLQQVYDQLIVKQQATESFLQRLQKKVWPQKPKVIKGLYLWGSVGIGKTYLMDLFYFCLPLKRKMRMHFHQFMQQVHRGLKRLQGEPDPLKIIAHEFASQTQVLCFDEFFVDDIADAMLLAGLFEALFAEGVCLIATSNVPPDELYKSGLQRSAFLPAIELLKQNTQVIHLDTNVDYRSQQSGNLQYYFTPLVPATDAVMRECFLRFASGMPTHSKALTIAGRDIVTIEATEDTVWFDFDVICNVPRSQQDYLVIAEQFKTVLISNVPKIKKSEDHKVTYLINLIDIFYDAKVRLVLSAAVPLDELYTAGRKLFEFKRTHSRLLEMLS